MNKNLFNIIEEGIDNKEKIFMYAPEDTKYTYGDVFDISGKYANALSGLGVKIGDRVAVQVDKTPDVLFLYLACLRMGAVYLPLNTEYTTREIAYFLGDATPALVVCRPHVKDDISHIIDSTYVKHIETLDTSGTGSLSRLASRSDAAFKTVARQESDLAAILYTSGTTGRSKGAMLTHGNLTSNAMVLASYWRFTSEDVLLHILPIYHTHGLFVATNTCLVSGSSIIFLPKFKVSEVIRQLPEATVMMGVPTHYVRLLASPEFTRDRAGYMRLFTSGSAPLLPEIHNSFFDRTGQKILERYGMTETNMNTSNPYDGDRVPGSVGFPLPGVSLRIADPESHKILVRGEIGIIEVKGPNVFAGYWQMPEKTAQEFQKDGFFITGDLGKIDDRGYVHIVGREKDLIITGGLNVYPAEVETVLNALPEILESAVFAISHPDFGEGVAAAVVPREGATIDEAAIKLELAATLAKFKIPKRIVTLDALPRNTMGKVQKNILRDQYKDLNV